MPATDTVASDVPVCQFMKSFHLTMPELQGADPAPFFARLRAECPVAYSELGGGFHVFSTYEDVTFILQHPETFSNSQTSIPAAPKPLGATIPTQIDPPDLQKYRQLLTTALGPGAIKALEPSVRATARRLLDPIAANRRCDFLSDFAVPLPCETFCNLLGIPPEGLKQFLEWKDLLIKAGVSTSEELRAKSRETRVLVEQYFRDIYEERTAAGDPGDDLMGVLMTARFGGERPLTIDEMVNYTELLFSAGLDTVTSQLALAIVYLANHPDRRDELVNDLSLVPAAVDELIRHDTLVGVGRKVVRDVEIRGVQPPCRRDGDGADAIRRSRRGAVPQRRRGRLPSPEQPTPRVRDRAAPVPRLAPGPDGDDRRPRGDPPHDPDVPHRRFRPRHAPPRLCAGDRPAPPGRRLSALLTDVRERCMP